MDSQWLSVLRAQMLHKSVEVLQAGCFACFSFPTPHPPSSYILSELSLEHSLVFLSRCDMRVYLEVGCEHLGLCCGSLYRALQY